MTLVAVERGISMSLAAAVKLRRSTIRTNNRMASNRSTALPAHCSGAGNNAVQFSVMIVVSLHWIVSATPQPAA